MVKLKAQSAKRKSKIKKLKFLVLSFSFTFFALHFALIWPLAFAQPVSGRDLIESAQVYDGKNIAYTGEIIGDIMRRGNYAWINVSDKNKAIGVWLEASLLKGIAYAGGYRSRGDIVEVAGVFHRACPEHGGDLDIHALQIKKISPGRYNSEVLNLDTGKRNAGIVLLGIVCLIWILAQLKFK